MALVLGVDSSTQSCKVVVRDADSGELVRSGRATHPDGTEVAPQAWWDALRTALDDAGGLDGVEALSIAGQQHGMVCLDGSGEVVRDALLWNDTRSAAAAAALVEEIGADGWADATGVVPVASITLAKLRWLARTEPEHAAATAAVCLPHDWLTWRLRGATGLDELITDRSDASGTGYFDGRDYRPDLLEHGFGRTPVLPRVLGPAESVQGPGGIVVGAGAGDNAAAGLGVDAGDDVVVSLGTSGTVFARSARRAQDPSGIVAGFSDATGAYLPLIATLNASRVLDATRRLLGVDHDELGRLALEAEPGSGGLVVVPYLEGERTPNLPDATGALHGWTLASGTRENLARAAVEGMLFAQRVGLEALREQGVSVTGVTLVGGATRSEAVCRIAAQVFEVPVRVPEPGEYVADGAARQAAWALRGGPTPPVWTPATEPARYEPTPAPEAWDRYREAAGRFLERG
ncbi:MULTISPECIES: xylulokinase [Pseudonocardia]|uniref:Xylulose kinase n=2 Tax=Pseudonocardia TaxID=1847 RepID=A0A1Y2N6R2_PSEAH|nr:MULTISPECIES: FGGY family carbohydrate kinase [Pseudonocardia]OSY42797.1 Xylulose kinase [Pseudonocardia autotrophica]TDN77374.1 xylulokinase [Pseudonocardia autotrophica]BBG01397.1 xylulokinase [Pseudonocardia autotrophica]GEC24453.1 xylulokinase [Pseudonocardia saturnea]